MIRWAIDAEPRAVDYVVRALLEGRAIVDTNAPGAVGRARIELRPFLYLLPRVLDFLTLRVDGLTGAAQGPEGLFFGGGFQVGLGAEFPYVGVGLALGLSTLAQPVPGAEQREAFTFAPRLRFGNRSHFHVEAELIFGYLTVPEDIDDVRPRFGAEAVLPIDVVDIALRGQYSLTGVGLGELAVTFWPGGSTRRGMGISLHGGASGILYQPNCPTDLRLACGPSEVYLGPHVGFGVEGRH